MSLDFDLRQIEGYEALDAGLVECMVFMSMFIGHNNWTSRQIDQIWTRVQIWERVYGPIRANKQPLTKEEVHSFIGLRTNATTKTKAEFDKHIIRHLYEVIR